MPKIEDVKIEAIWEDTKVKGVEKIETIYPETIELPNYQYWQSQNTLDYDLALRNKPSWWWQIKTWILANINTNWSIVVNTVWFLPKLIKFTAIYSNWASSAISIWHYCNGVNNSVVSYENAADFSSNSRCFRLWWTNWLWRVTAVDNTWFTLNVSNSWWISYTVLYECFW